MEAARANGDALRRYAEGVRMALAESVQARALDDAEPFDLRQLLTDVLLRIRE